ncbi:MAG: methyltransferase domain-containing protein [Bacteroidota bacterium]
MQSPLSHRGGIPFFYKKTEKEFQKDPYEKYEEMVVRQSALHLADEVWEGYPWQAVLDFAGPHFPVIDQHQILEIGCGVGRWIGDLAKRNPAADCWGIDYSYQMLKRAREFWQLGKGVLFDLTNKGFSKRIHVSGHELNNLQFGLAKAESLPFGNDRFDFVFNSFLLDRLDDPDRGLEEMFRVLKPEGRLLFVSPLNFSKSAHWNAFYPPIKLFHLLTQIGFQVIDWREDLIVREPLDGHGNAVMWNCLGVVADKTI